ncbi:hypothetical protein DERF_012973 [Dermatophagoides farinae]|uniref:Uncharacterized protein n=1 Tax=Dermatophagoides farinae TaxID=6954 RepID=A0A922KZY0_DERFA|nr:hypothetical protein DERF_012973 [Dermatophagoides farinae]
MLSVARSKRHARFFRFLHSSSPSHRHTCFGLFIDYVMRQHSHRSLSTYFMHKMYEKLRKESHLCSICGTHSGRYISASTHRITHSNRFVDKKRSYYNVDINIISGYDTLRSYHGERFLIALRSNSQNWPKICGSNNISVRSNNMAQFGIEASKGGNHGRSSPLGCHTCFWAVHSL